MHDTSLMCYGIVFQEFGDRRSGFTSTNKLGRSGAVLRSSWLVVCTLLTWSYMGNLKASLVGQDHEKPTRTLNEMVDKDLRQLMSLTFLNYLNSTSSLSRLNSRLACQGLKRNELYDSS